MSNQPFENAIAGKLAESIYLGEIAQYTLNAHGTAETIRISELNPRRIVRDTEQKLYATAEAEDIVILKKDSENVAFG